MSAFRHSCSEAAKRLSVFNLHNVKQLLDMSYVTYPAVFGLGAAFIGISQWGAAQHLGDMRLDAC
jgi:hypothetical protein